MLEYSLISDHDLDGSVSEVCQLKALAISVTCLFIFMSWWKELQIFKG